MDLEIISRLAKSVEGIHHVTFTGGEPSLNAKAIEHFRWAVYFNNCGIDSFWLKVNARVFKQDFL
jgi:organic radical activating enzyme